MLVVVAAIQWRFDYVRTSVDKTVAGLEVAKLYLLDRDYRPCAGDVARYRSKLTGYPYFGRVAAAPGAALSLASDGYIISGTTYPKDASWIARAKEQLGAAASHVDVPDGHVLIVNSEFAADSKREDWAYEILPVEQIEGTLTHILLARDLRRIGERVTAQTQTCLIGQASHRT